MATNRRLVELALHVREGCWTRNIDESLFAQYPAIDGPGYVVKF